MSTLLVRDGNDYLGKPLLTTMNLYEHEVLFILPGNLLTEMKANAAVTESVHESVAARMAEIVKWIERGHTLIVLGLSPAPYWFNQGNDTSETAIEQLPPFNKVKLTAKSGASIRCSPAVASALDPLVRWIKYDFVLEGPNLIPLLFVRTTQNTVDRPDMVAGAIELGKGFVIFAPDGRQNVYWRALYGLPALLRSSNAEFPSWTDRFHTGWEKVAFSGVATRKAELDRLKTELAELVGEIDQARKLKMLFVGTGASFEAAVAAALVELGLQVVKGPHPRADLLATNGKRIAAIEAKGVDGGAREEYVRQVMMWMPEVDAALAMTTESAENDPVLDDYRRQLTNLNLNDRDPDQDCKGILVLGTFRSAPLDQRTQADFPENVKAVLARQDICALTGIQLFVLVVLARSDEAIRKQVRQALFNTRGVLEMGLDWTRALEPADQSKAQIIS